MIKIVVDSTCCPSEKYIKENGIYVNPLRILFDDREYVENDALYDEIYEKMEKTKEIIEKHFDGRIWFENTEDGVQFIIRIPLYKKEKHTQ